MMYRPISLVLVTAAATALLSDAAPVAAQPPPPETPAPADPAAEPASEPAEQPGGAPTADGLSPEDQALLLLAQTEIIEIVDPTPPGSAHRLGEAELEKFEHDDIHKILAAVPGVYIRQEDGYGLRPNIGMRGSGSERSAKIALMEDGVLIAPAPYSAPAAYYFPLATRMSGVEVMKGPAAIKYGPNTVGGSLNLLTRPIPAKRSGAIDLAGGSDLYGKLHGWAAERTEHLGFLVEGVKLRSDGFKELDGGGTTGFDKHNLMVKALGQRTFGKQYHEVHLKLGYADEVSDETYTGLTDRDFAANPYRRYAATQLDRMDWRHLQLQLRHRVEVPGKLAVTTTLYRHDFARDWAKLDGFAGQADLNRILTAPDAGSNAIYYAVLTGEADSASSAESLVVGTNSRDFVSQGVQVVGTAEREWGPTTHNLDVGLRFHADAADRFHYENTYRMTSGRLVSTGAPTTVTRFATGSAEALAAYVQDKVTMGKLALTGGVRGELIQTTWEDHADPAADTSDRFAVLIPGGGAVYQVLPSLGVLAGVHKGFVPTAPGSQPGIKPEESVNYEAGFRWSSLGASAEVIGFFSDYSNLKGSCTFSSGCMAEQVDDEFNGGAVHVLGLEALAAAEPRLGTFRFPLALTYTFNRSRFQSSFTSENPQWGDVMKGDEVPYLPDHQLRAQAGAGTERWELFAAARYTSAMRDVAGQGEAAPTALTDASMVFDLGAHLRLGRWGEAYLTIDNLLDEAYVVARRPYGARPGVPRLFTLGYKNSF